MSIRGTSKFHSMPVSVNSGTSYNGINRGYDANQFGTSNQYNPTPSPSLLKNAQQIAKQVEGLVDTLSDPIKPYLPALGRFLIVATFLEDAIRIVSQWSEQVNYIWKYRHLPYWLTVPFLMVNVFAMIAGSGLIIMRKHTMYAVPGLLAVVVSQAFVYGLLFDLTFVLRNTSLVGGLLMVLSDSFIRDKSRSGIAGLLVIEDKDKGKYFLLVGRILLMFLFLGFISSAKWSVVRSVFHIFGFSACVMVVVGFKAKLNAMLLVISLAVYNLMINHYWTYDASHPVRDLLKYEFFQTLSIIGGLVMVVNAGAGKISIDEKKKIY
ncbi:ER to Golgi transport-related protein [Nadsonia fulvescens var. elongata DSM 6958]|uniref:ER to Golgi transport-related protein n=1 Tax=Nadsonia fulvescens var. elongata DSM 6958 TaxID=857566 RepID=A0A1E3PQU5_9ASCO|nr:ER to Golgi transport-related protein [Nadsonia fulvescens var. elongata DSM 6958]